LGTGHEFKNVCIGEKGTKLLEVIFISERHGIINFFDGESLDISDRDLIIFKEVQESFRGRQ